MAKAKLTAGRVAGFKCDAARVQDFLWCNEVAGLGVRATKNEAAKAYIYQAKVNGKTMRSVIGKVSVWSIPDAQAEARRLQVLIDTGNDPRQIKADKLQAAEEVKLAKAAQAQALAKQSDLEAVTVGGAWAEYIEVRKPFWGALHLNDHITSMQAGGRLSKSSNFRWIYDSGYGYL